MEIIIHQTFKLSKSKLTFEITFGPPKSYHIRQYVVALWLHEMPQLQPKANMPSYNILLMTKLVHKDLSILTKKV